MARLNFRQTRSLGMAVFLALAASGAVVSPASLSAQTLCAQRAQVLGMLASRYGEERRSMGMAGGDRIVEIFTSDETGTWTITVTNVTGVTCLVASGRHFEAVTRPVDGEPL